MESATSKKLRMLIADDDPQILSMLSVRFSKLGYEVVEAADGVQALAKARASKPDIVLLDVMMPGKNGWEVARELRLNHGTKEIGILILTAIGTIVNEMTSPLYGADDYCDKPFEFAELDRKITAILEKRRVQQQQG
ncbi:MAG: response regulator [Deltaproteobacteria bacterium]|nr:response regulator [Deltaproteobacteria bacterium]